MHTSPSGKRYVGITSKQPHLRWGKNGNNYYYNDHFTRAINKYGWDNFKHEILFNNLTAEEASKIEIELIRKYNLTDENYGYNHNNGGIGDYSCCKSVVKLTLLGDFVAKYDSLRLAAEDFGCGDISIASCCYEMTGLYDNYLWIFEDDYNDDYVKYRVNRIIESSIPNSVGIKVYSLDGTFINSYPSLTEAAKYLNEDYTKLSRACMGIDTELVNYICEYENQCYKTIAFIKYTKDIPDKPVVKLNYRTGEYIERYDNCIDVFNKTKMDPLRIYKTCIKTQSLAYKYLWMFEDEYLDSVKNNVKLGKNIYGAHLSRPVVQLSTDGKILGIFESTRQAGRMFNANGSKISALCNHDPKRKTAYGYKWEFLENVDQSLLADFLIA